jgi:hypothetical protein
MSFLTREQLDKYVKDLASKTPKTTPLNTQSKSPPVTKVSPTSPLSSPKTSSSSISSVVLIKRKMIKRKIIKRKMTKRKMTKILH